MIGVVTVIVFSIGTYLGDKHDIQHREKHLYLYCKRKEIGSLNSMSLKVSAFFCSPEGDIRMDNNKGSYEINRGNNNIKTLLSSEEQFKRNCELTDLGHELAKQSVYPVIFNVREVSELEVLPTAIYRDDACPQLKRLDGKRAIDFIVKKSSKAFSQFSNPGVESYVQEKWRDDKYRFFKDVHFGVGNPGTVKGELFKLNGASHFLFGYVDRVKREITEWLCIKDVTRLVDWIHEGMIEFKTVEDSNGKMTIYIPISTLKDNGFLYYHYPYDIQ